MAVTKEFKVQETTIADVHAAYTSKSLTARKLVEMYFNRIAAYDKSGPEINALISLNPRALDEADRLDTTFQASGFVGPLHGVLQFDAR